MNMSRDVLVREFLKRTGTQNVAAAQRYLNTSEGELEVAITLYESEPTLSNPPQNTQRTKDNLYQSSTGTGRLMTLADSKKMPSTDLDDDTIPSYYAGGSNSSGIQIEDPHKPFNVNKLVRQVFEGARRAGSQSGQDVTQKKENDRFGGRGYRLGDTDLGTGSMPFVVPKNTDKLTKIITFYRDGFTINDGPLRLYSEPENAQFLQDIDHGYVPRELESEAGIRDVHTQLIDRKDENYKEPEKPLVAFSGSGFSLQSDSIKPSVASSPSHQTFSLDESLPIVQVQVRFHDGTLKIAKLNLSHTIMDLRNWVDEHGPRLGPYVLMQAFPKKLLGDLNQTVEDAQLADAAILQKLD